MTAHDAAGQPERVLEREAGSAMDAEVLRQVFGGPRTPFQDERGDWFYANEGDIGRFVFPLPEYSTDIAAAMTVLDKLNGQFVLERDDDGWYCHLSARTGRFDDCGGWEYGDGVTAATAPLAICLAALSVCARVNQPPAATPRTGGG